MGVFGGKGATLLLSRAFYGGGRIRPRMAPMRMAFPGGRGGYIPHVYVSLRAGLCGRNCPGGEISAPKRCATVARVRSGHAMRDGAFVPDGAFVEVWQ